MGLEDHSQALPPEIEPPFGGLIVYSGYDTIVVHLASSLEALFTHRGLFCLTFYYACVNIHLKDIRG